LEEEALARNIKEANLKATVVQHPDKRWQAYQKITMAGLSKDLFRKQCRP
jgi:hypothetical protein